MVNVKLVKADRDLAIKLDYMLCIKNKTNWKNNYIRKCLLYGEEPIPQEKMTDEEYYKLIYNQKFQYYFLNSEEVIGRAQLSKRGENYIDIQYILIEKEFCNQGYGKKIFQMLEDEIFLNNEIEGIFVEDMSAFGQTTKIVKKLGYEENEFGQFVKYNSNKGKIKK